MKAASPNSAVGRFVDYFGELGPRWGLPANACRVHAYLYLSANSISESEISKALSMDRKSVADALAFLNEYAMAAPTETSSWQTNGDPWDMLISGLEQRRRRELPAALATLKDCHREASADKSARRLVAGQIGKMLALVEDLAAIDAQAQRLSPKVIRDFVSVSGRAARFLERAFGSKGSGMP
jgi:DNA-binding transcriptional regulator GbsR (MarR family)